MNKSFGSSLFVLVIMGGIIYAYSVYKSRHPDPSVVTAPAHVVAYSPGADYISVEDDKTKLVSMVSIMIDPLTRKAAAKIDPATKVGDKGTLLIEFPARVMKFEPDPK
jgi:hypothetical protein